MSSAAVVGGWCILFYQVQNQHRTYKKLYLLREDADFLFITVFDSPAIPPDLNPTEFSIISVLSGTLWEKHHKLRAAIKATWASASCQLCCWLTVSMPCCNHAVIYGKEAPARCWGYKWAAWDTEVNELWAKIIEIKAKKLWTIWKFTFFELTESNINQNKETKKPKKFSRIFKI